MGEESVREELERITRKYDDLVKKLRDKVGDTDSPLFRQPCNQRLQALSHLAGTFEGGKLQKDLLMEG